LAAREPLHKGEEAVFDSWLEKRKPLRHSTGMSFAEMKEVLPSLSSHERLELIESLHALQEGVSVEEFRAMNAALEEELNDPSPTVPIEQVYQDLKNLTRSNAA
jgi:hypothetical protein